MKKKWIKIIVILSVILIILGIVAAIAIPKINDYLPYYYDKNGTNQQDIPYTLTIEKEDFANEVANKLADNDVIISAVRFLGYLEEKDPDFKWLNGVYYLNANMSYDELYEALQNPDEPVTYTKVVIPEGKTVLEISEIVAKQGLCTREEFLDAADSYDYDYYFMDELKSRDQSLIAYKLEGYLFPATYEFRDGTTTARDIVDKMLLTFTQYVTEDMVNEASDIGLSLNEFVSFGAVIQDEAFSTESMSGVSSVFWNRLNSDIYPRLESDPTMFYAEDLANLDHFTEKMEDAYSTYSCTGLPIGPTNCPGVDALNAVLEPDETDYFYFVTDINGKFYFNTTLGGHNQTIRSLKNQNLWG